MSDADNGSEGKPREDRAKAERRLKNRRAKVEQIEKEKGRLKWFLLLAVVSWPAGLPWGWWAAAWIFFGWMTFYFVGLYSNFFHLKNARTQLQLAEEQLALLGAGDAEPDDAGPAAES
jgi:hypothetical protein